MPTTPLIPANHCLAAALAYAAAGLRVVCLHNLTPFGGCTCKAGQECKAIGKHPRFTGWNKGGAPTEDDIRKWWHDHSRSNVGIATGSLSGVFGIDIDPKGVERWAELAAKNGGLPETWQASSGRPNCGHWYFSYPNDGRIIRNTQNNEVDEVLGPGIDVRGDGGQLVAPPSFHYSGRQYTWVDGRGPGGPIPVATAPEWLLEMVVKKPKQRASERGSNGGRSGPTSHTASRRSTASRLTILPKYVRVAVQEETDRLANRKEGDRNDLLNKVGFNLGQIVGAGALDESDAVAAIDQAREACGLPASDMKTIMSGLEAGKKQPRDLSEVGARAAANHDTTSRNGSGRTTSSADDNDNGDPASLFSNYFTDEQEAGDGKTKLVKVGYSAKQLAAQLFEKTGGWPKRVGRLLFRRDGHAPGYMESNHDLFAWINDRWDTDGENPVAWASGPDKITREQFYAYLQQAAQDYDAVEPYPHFPSLPRHYYLHPPCESGDTSALMELIGRFSPAEDVDADLLLGFFMSIFWGGPLGQRPAWLFTGEEDDRGVGRGVGKSTVAKMAARLCGGFLDCSPKEEMTETVKRLLSPAGRNKRVLLLDNLKTLKFSWAELESLITTDTISGRQMYVGEGRRPNTITVCITLNGASLSKDMAQRCVIVKMSRPEFGGQWEDETTSLIDSKRWEIISGIRALFDRPAAALSSFSRWGAWESSVLARLPSPRLCQEVIRQRQTFVDEDAAEAEMVREQFVSTLRSNNYDPICGAVFFGYSDVAKIVNRATGEHRPHTRVSPYLSTLGVPELRKKHRRDKRGWVWRGENCTEETKEMDFDGYIDTEEQKRRF